MRDKEKIISYNTLFIKKYSIEQWIDILKKVAIHCLPIYDEESIEGVEKATDFYLEQDKDSIIHLSILTSLYNGEEIRIKMDREYIEVYKQNKRTTTFILLNQIPIETLRLFNEL